MKKHILSVLVENEFGVLARVSGMFAGRGYNIDSLSVGPTHDPKFSHMTIVTTGSDAIVQQILKQLNRLVDVVRAEDLTEGDYINRETMLIRVRYNLSNKNEILSLAEKSGALLIETESDTLDFEITGEREIVEQFLQSLESYGIKEFARTGTIAIHRENKN